MQSFKQLSAIQKFWVLAVTAIILGLNVIHEINLSNADSSPINHAKSTR
jgi:hypothetical protein